jgi:hypothetical protein
VVGERRGGDLQRAARDYQQRAIHETRCSYGVLLHGLDCYQ